MSNMKQHKTIEPTNQDFRSKLYQIQDMLVQGVQEIPADKSDKPINEKMENYYNLRRKWIDHSMEEVITLIDEGVPKKKTWTNPLPYAIETKQYVAGYNQAIDDIRTNLGIKGKK